MPRRPQDTETAFMKSIRVMMMNQSLAEGSINLYLSKLKTLNGADFTSLAFLRNMDAMNTKLNAMENINTRKSYTTAIVSVLSTMPPPNKTYAPFLTKYRAMLNTQRTEWSKINQNDKTETQKENWMDWTEVLAKQKELGDAVAPLSHDDLEASPSNVAKWEDYMLICLYTMFPPRRNQDYYEMKVGTGEDKNFNYFDPKKNTFIFHKYKTAKTHGVEKFPLPASLREVIDRYVKIRGLSEGDWLLYTYDTERKAPNLLTRKLNSIFGKKIGVSMLRHIYDTHKYGSVLKEMEKDAEMMGHTMATQKDYIKTDEA